MTRCVFPNRHCHVALLVWVATRTPWDPHRNLRHLHLSPKFVPTKRPLLSPPQFSTLEITSSASHTHRMLCLTSDFPRTFAGREAPSSRLCPLPSPPFPNDPPPWSVPDMPIYTWKYIFTSLLVWSKLFKGSLTIFFQHIFFHHLLYLVATFQILN